VFSSADTIVALATPPGRGAIGVVRLSGPEAHSIALTLLGRHRPLEPRRVTLARIREAGSQDAGGRTLDHVLATWFAAPHSFTAEDVVEISAHGSPVLVRRIIELAMAQGARLAEPGEFTFRAHLHGRVDLVQAEAVADLVDAVTPLQARTAMDQLEGTLTRAIGALDADLFDLAARLEASLDFPDEGFHFITPEETAAALARVQEALDALLRDGRAGRLIREGATVVLAGRPNAGKSSLFNALVGSARAIVTPLPGTTRDLLTERVDIDGIAVTLVDTAGLGEPGDPIEVEGMARARQAVEIARLTLVILDGSQRLDEADRALLTGAKNCVAVITKSDLPRRWSPDRLGVTPEPPVDVSAITGAGIDELRRAIVRALTARDDWREPPAITNTRHLSLVQAARAAVHTAIESVTQGAPEELALAELGRAREALEEITGRRTADDLLQHVFSRFCVGK
jgi:tRNA modification GTPase